MVQSLRYLIAFGLVQVSVGDDCCSCITGGGGMACADRCGSQSSACQTCVSNGGGSGCINDGRCSCGAPTPTPSPTPSPSPSGGSCRLYSGTAGSREDYLLKAARGNSKSGTELAQFMAQCAHECDSFNTMTEYGSGEEYEGRTDLGNIYPGDGVRYKGRGYIQITGRYNYRTYGGYIGQDLENNPTLAEQPSIAAQVALQYWNRIVKPSVSDFTDTTKVTKLINGGTNGLADRQAKFSQYSAVCSSAATEKEVEITLPWLEASTCSNKGHCGNAYQACCIGFQLDGYPCGCHLSDGGAGNSIGDCGDCGAAYQVCCAGYAATGNACTCDVTDGGAVAV